jgi:hypothetical protein
VIVIFPAIAWVHTAIAATAHAVQAHTPSTATQASDVPGLTQPIVFGLLIAYFTGLCLCYRRRYRAARIGVPLGLACITICTVIQGAWPAAIVLAVFTAGTVRLYGNDFVVKKTPRRRRFVHENRFALSPSRSAHLYWLN